MSSIVWTGNAAAIRQVTTITVGGTWLDTETATLTMNGKDLILTLVGNEATTAVATALKEMWMNATRLTGISSTDATSNAGGQEFGEFSEVTATVSGSVVTLTANVAGVPFVVSVAESSSSGTLTLATPQSCTGPNYWSNGDNWSGGSVPTNDDIVMFMNNNVDCLYGLPNASLEVTFNTYMHYTGRIGLPQTNRANPSKPYWEYRQRHVLLDNSGSGTAKTHLFGLGEGQGSPLINIAHNPAADLVVSAVVYNTGQPAQINSFERALNLVIANDPGGGAVTVLRGHVNLGANFGEVPAFSTLNIGTSANIGDANVTIDSPNLTFTVNQYGGQFQYQDTTGSAANCTINAFGGTSIIRDVNSAGTMTITLADHHMKYACNRTVAALIVRSGGTFDLENDGRAVTITTCDLFKGASLLDDFARGTYTAGYDCNGCGQDDVVVRMGNNRRFTPGTAA